MVPSTSDHILLNATQFSFVTHEDETEGEMDELVS
jgi:hypothetical protein